MYDDVWCGFFFYIEDNLYKTWKVLVCLSDYNTVILLGCNMSCFTNETFYDYDTNKHINTN